MATAAEPRWLTHARTLIGTAEIPGARHSATIMGWIKVLGSRVLGINVTSDETAWCGTFIAWIFHLSGIAPAKIAVRAKAWLDWGRVLKDARLGCVMIFDRAGGGHVGLYVGEDRTHYHILGGNQGNRVSIMRLEKSRMVGMRWPAGESLPLPNRVWLNPNGSASSSNEA